MTPKKYPKGFVNPEELVGKHYTKFDLDLLKFEAIKEVMNSSSRLSWQPLPAEQDRVKEIKRLEKRAGYLEKRALEAYERGLASIV